MLEIHGTSYFWLQQLAFRESKSKISIVKKSYELILPFFWKSIRTWKLFFTFQSIHCPFISFSYCHTVHTLLQWMTALIIYICQCTHIWIYTFGTIGLMVSTQSSFLIPACLIAAPLTATDSYTHWGNGSHHYRLRPSPIVRYPHDPLPSPYPTLSFESPGAADLGLSWETLISSSSRESAAASFFRLPLQIR